MPTTAILLGASGSVGKALLTDILRSAHFSRVVVVGRRSILAQASANARLEECLVPDMQPQALRQAVAAALQGSDAQAVGFSVLGVGAGTAQMSLAQHRAIDVDLNAAFAAGLKDSGRVQHLVFMSAIGADITARVTGSGAAGMPRYARVKGEAEHAVLAQGLACVSILRPSVIIGSVHTPQLLSVIAPWVSPLVPAQYRPIRTTEIAQAMVALARNQPNANAIYTYQEMKALAATEA
ncbi:NAD(P)H-binding protein [Rhodoferax sp.]|jgi:uncharacterized protein YbjT (DUF2867 family)|uniref:NAD(P)H-binding protein n=1 Tax=Rhodoferax sp. TaxID=50421 RepID=UPI003784236C